MSVPAAQTLKDDARDTWDTTKHVASRTGETVENGAASTGRFVERGLEKTGNFIERSTSPLTDRLRSEPRVTLNNNEIMTPGTISAGSDLIVRNRGTSSERFEIKGHGLDNHVFLKPGQSKVLDLDLPKGNYELMSTDGGMTRLRVR